MPGTCRYPVRVVREIIGIDIGKGQWTVVRATCNAQGHLGPPRAELVPYQTPIPLDEALAVIDIPVGLLDAPEASASPKGLSGDRDVDRGARKWCASTSSVFAPPTAQQLASSVAEHARAATAGERRVLANVAPGGLGAQSFELVPAIESARRLKLAHPNAVFEAHPEVTFTMLAGGKVAAKKTTLLGKLVRLSLLRARLGAQVADWLLRTELESGVAVDNWLDALAMLVVAHDWATGARSMLATRDGLVQPWDGRRDRLLAIPRSAHVEPVPKLGTDELLAIATNQSVVRVPETQSSGLTSSPTS